MRNMQMEKQLARVYAVILDNGCCFDYWLTGGQFNENAY